LTDSATKKRRSRKNKSDPLSQKESDRLVQEFLDSGGKVKKYRTGATSKKKE